MKKGGLFLLILGFIMALCNAYSVAPSLDSLPDVVIGDTEDNVGGTIDKNFFRFPNAFIFDNYVQDSDTPVSSLKWSFRGGDGIIEINDLGPENSDNINPTNNLRAISNNASFRNILNSPKPDIPVYPNPGQSEIHSVLTLFASDGADYAYQPINVYTRNNADDSLIFNVGPFYYEPYTTQNRWKCYYGVGTQEAPETIGAFSGALGRLECKFATFPLPSPNFYQWLQSNSAGTALEGSIKYSAGEVYILRAKLSADSDTTVPYLRMRVQSLDNIWSACAVYGDLDIVGQKGAAKSQPNNFYMIWEPQGSTGDAFVAVDIIGLREYTGEVYVDEVAAYKISQGNLNPITTEQTITSFSDWAKIGANVSVSPTNIVFADTTTFSTAAKFIDLADPIANGKIYRVKANIAKIGSTMPDQIRMRINETSNPGYSSYFIFNDLNNNYLSAIPKELVLYHWGLNDPAAEGDLTLALDTVNLSTSSANVVLSQIIIEKVTLPVLKE